MNNCKYVHGKYQVNRKEITKKGEKKIEYQFSNPTELWACKQKIKRSTTTNLNL